MNGRGFKKSPQVRLIKNLTNVVRLFSNLKRNVDIGLNGITVNILATNIN